MFGFKNFYNETLRRYTIVFGTLFNDITLIKQASDGTNMLEHRVPIAYGPKEKFLARLDSEPDLSIDGNPRQTAITLPRMSFEIIGINYAPDRKLTSTGRINVADPSNPIQLKGVYNPVPYDIRFQLNIMTRTYDDAPQIVEQILPFFTPEWTNTVRILDDVDIALDCALVLNSVQNNDSYEGDFKSRRSIVWTLDFTMKCFFFGPPTTKKSIRIASAQISTPNIVNQSVVSADGTETSIYYDIGAANNLDGFGNSSISYDSTIQPGLTANGQPTTDINASVDPTLIKPSDNYGYVVTITEYGV